VRDESRLSELADALADGLDVDWDEAEKQSTDVSDSTLIRELRVVAAIAGMSRQEMPKETPITDQPQTWGHLRLIAVVGTGAFGTVYRAWDTHLEREVALKVIPARPCDDSSETSRALKEARLLAKLHHPNVVTVYGADCHDGTFGLWMQLIKGRTLDEVLRFHGPMGAREATSIAVDICRALAAVHGAGLLHRDIKASNVMREDGGRIVLMDFGAGRHTAAAEDPAVVLVGSPLYLAPELFLGAKPSAASDIYSVGVLLHHLVTGRYPVEANEIQEIVSCHEQGRRQSLRDVRPDLPIAFISVIDRALSRDPAERFASAGAFGAAIAATGGIPYGPDSEPHRDDTSPRWIRRGAVAAVAIVALATGAMFLRNERSDERGVPAVAPAAPPVVREVPADAPGTYRVDARFFTVRNGVNVPLAADSRVAPGENIFMTLDLSRPAFAYVINQDDYGEAYVLFPLPGQEPANPLPASRTNRLPGGRENDELFWQVTSAGGREHFLLFVAPERLTAFEQVLTALPRAEEGRPVLSAQLPKDALGTIRGVGGLTTSAQTPTPTDSQLAALQPIAAGGETANGLWARQITFQNPGK